MRNEVTAPTPLQEEALVGRARMSAAPSVGNLPAALQLKILSLVAGGSSSEGGAADASAAVGHQTNDLAPPTSHDPCGWACGLSARCFAHGYAWQDGMVDVDAARALLIQAQALDGAGALAPAGMGASMTNWHDAKARGDSVAWVPLQPGPEAGGVFQALWASSGWRKLRDSLAHVRDALNRDAAEQPGSHERLRLPEKVMLARYPEGSRYVRHSDVSAAVPHRRVTAIFYLNDAWEADHGGQLLTYPRGGDEACAVAPVMGRLLIFRSHIEHEVCVTQRPRWAVTAWLSVEAAAGGAGVTAPAAPRASPSAPSHSVATAAILQLAALATAASAAPPRPAPLVPTPDMVGAGEGGGAGDGARGGAGDSAGGEAGSTADEGRAGGDSQLGATQAGTSTGGTTRGGATQGGAALHPAHISPPLVPPERATVFVSIASYRDPEAPHTIRSLFERAAVPSRVFVGVCFQCDSAADADCIDLSGLPPQWRANVRTLHMPWRAARGPVWARFLIQRRLYAREDYVLQIDSHTRAAAGWDARLIAMLGRCASPKPVLTTYPLPYTGTGDAATLSTEERLSLLCTRAAADAFGADGMLRFRARLLATAPAAPLPTPFWAAGFSFSAGALVSEVPYDPHLPFLFFGEEISVALRMWTRGWDLFAPDEHVVFHLWARSHRSTFWEVDGGAALKRAAQARVRRLLTAQPLEPGGAERGTQGGHGAVGVEESTAAGGGQGVAATPAGAIGGEWDADDVLAGAPGVADPIWGAGSVRSLRMYERFSGVDFAAMRVSAQAERGGMPGEACFWDLFSCLESMAAVQEKADAPAARGEAASQSGPRAAPASVELA